jgi:phosphatidylinositol alpha-1,6-mannosyltransferase
VPGPSFKVGGGKSGECRVTESARYPPPDRTKAGKTVLLALSGAFGAPGGIEMYSRLLIKASVDIADETGGRSAVVILNDRPTDVDARYTSGLPVSACSGSKFRFVIELARLVLTLKPDVIIFGLVNFGGLSLLVTPLCPSSEHWFVAHGLEAWKRLRVDYRLAVSTAKRVLAVSDYTRRELIRHNHLDPSRVGLLQCAVDPVWAEAAERVLSESVAPVKQSLLTVARMVKSEGYKGIEQVLKALSLIRSRAPQLRYVVVGEGDDRARLELLAKQLDLLEAVEFRGRITSMDLARTYAESTLFVMPSTCEGFGIVFLEAAFFRKPAIAATAGGSPEVVIGGRTGVLVDADDVEGLSEAILQLLHSEVDLRRLGQAAREHVDAMHTFGRFKDSLGRYLDPAGGNQTG